MSIKIDIQRELLLTGCGVEETKRKARQREEHIKNLIARVQQSHEEKKPKYRLSNRQSRQTTVRTSLFEFPSVEDSGLGTLAPSRSDGRLAGSGVYTPKKPSSKTERPGRPSLPPSSRRD